MTISDFFREIKKSIRIAIVPSYNVSEGVYDLYKKANFCYRHNWERLEKRYFLKLYRKYNCWISPRAKLGENVCFPHPIGIVIGNGVEIGNNCTIYQNVTLGRKERFVEGYPKIGNNVIIYCNSCVLGNIEIGDNTIVGCNSVVLKSVEENSKCIGVVK